MNDDSNADTQRNLGIEGLNLADELAISRTLLANERTLLAYLRSSVALIIAGITIIHFTPSGWFLGVGFACVPVGVVFGGIGLDRYLKMNRRIHAMRGRHLNDSDGGK